MLAKIVLWVIAVFVLFVTWWSLRGRDWLHAKPWAWSRAMFAYIEPIEIKLWHKSQTILAARFKMLVGALLTVATQAGAIDITPLMPFIPDQHEWLVKAVWNMLPAIISVLGWVDEQNRKDTKTPLDIVALPDAALADPKVKAKVEQFEEARAVAVTEAKAVEAVGVKT